MKSAPIILAFVSVAACGQARAPAPQLLNAGEWEHQLKAISFTMQGKDASYPEQPLAHACIKTVAERDPTRFLASISGASCTERMRTIKDGKMKLMMTCNGDGGNGTMDFEGSFDATHLTARLTLVKIPGPPSKDRRIRQLVADVTARRVGSC